MTVSANKLNLESNEVIEILDLRAESQRISEIVDNEKPGLTPNEFSQTVPEISQDYTIEFANNRNPVAPTGLESNHTTPYVLMITAAGMAGLALIGGIVARRVRRRRQE